MEESLFSLTFCCSVLHLHLKHWPGKQQHNLKNLPEGPYVDHLISLIQSLSRPDASLVQFGSLLVED